MTDIVGGDAKWSSWPRSYRHYARLFWLKVRFGCKSRAGVHVLLMLMRINFYVSTICVLALVGVTALYGVEPTVDPQHAAAAFCFAALGVFASALTYAIARGAHGSIAFIPFLTAAVLAPSWITVLAVALSMTVGELLLRRSSVKAVFNIGQFSLATALAILVYLSLDGESLLNARSFAAPPYIALFLTFLAVNTAAVSIAVAITEHRKVWEVWRQNTATALVYDILSLPIAALFAWAYVKAGPTGAIALSVPLLGVRQLYKTNWQLENVNQELLQLMVAAIEARDPYTSGHSRRVSHYAKIVARALGMGARQVERVGVAALLHDVGKIHEVYAPILRKPDRLTPEELAIMQTHPIKSAELVENVTHLKDVVLPIRHHHENWDGSGYPDGLKGDEIPVTARIIMIADTIDAMTTDRPYRSALGEEDVRQELMRLRGKQFDAEMCDAFLASPLYRLVFSASAPTPPYVRVLTPSHRLRSSA